ncbi:MAG: ABC transporter permease, partial [Eubacterium sp.]
MKKILLLTLANLRKAKSQAVSFFGMALIAALLLSLGLVTWLNYDNNFHKKGVELNTEHGLLATQNNTPEGIRAVKAEFEGDNQTDVIQESPILFSQASFSYGQGEQSQNIVILNRSDEREMGKTLFVEEDHGINDKPIYLPYLYQTGGGYHMGDDFTLKIGGQSTTYTVAGFYENMMLGSTNLGVSSIMLEDKDYQALSESFAQSIDGTLFSIQLKDKTQNRPYMTEHVSKLTGGLLQNELAGAVYYDLAKQARTMTSSIGSIIVVAFSIIIVGIALIVVRFRIANSIEEGIKNIGVLKAIGYTNNQIAASILLQFLITGVLGCIVGIGLSYAVLPILSAGYAAQTGILWNQGFDGVSACITLLSITIMIALTAG